MRYYVVYVAVLLAGVISLVDGDEGFARRIAQWMSHKLELEGDAVMDLEALTSMKEQRAAEPRAPGIPGRDYPTVMTTSGPATGSYEDNVHSFYEIPYAQPPVGELRFRPPMPIETPLQEIDAIRNNGLQCMQLEGACILPQTGILCNAVNMDEDCLVLNIYVPNHVNLSDPNQPPDDRLAVMLYIHGGSFAYGSGQRADGRELANVANVVLVSINYRLGPFGFLVNKESGMPDINGNQGLKDQQLALKWVQDNIGNFGGDKDRVTIFGSSAGAQGVMFHTLSSTSAPLYLRAIQQSNPAYITFDTPEESQRVTDILARRLCNDTQTNYDCFMNADAIAITNRQLLMTLRNFASSDIHDFAEPFRPVIDGVEFTDQPMTLYKDGKWNSDKSMIVGVQTEELDNFQFLIPEPVPTGETVFTIATYYVVGIDLTDKVVKKYSAAYPPEDDDYLLAFSKELTHLIFVCPSRALARLASQTATGGAEIYFYANEHGYLDAACQARNNGSDEGCYYATHSAEGPFVMRRKTNPSEEDRQVQDIFSSYWGSFANTGNPSAGLETSLGDFTEWLDYNSESVTKEAASIERNGKFGPFLVKAASNGRMSGPWDNIRIKAPMSELEIGYEEDICDFWDSLGIYMEPIPLPVATTTTRKTPTDPPLVDTTSDSRPASRLSAFALLLPLVAIRLWM